jgi:hypothetical protein
MPNLWTVEITYDTREPGVTGMRVLHNMTDNKLKQFREDIFFAGLYVPSKEHPATQGEIISPYRLRSIYVWMQQPDNEKKKP